MIIINKFLVLIDILPKPFSPKINRALLTTKRFELIHSIFSNIHSKIGIQKIYFIDQPIFIFTYRHVYLHIFVLLIKAIF